MAHSEFYKESIEQPEVFWEKQARELAWYQFPKTILSKNKDDYYQWFEDGELNISYLCIDKHIEDGFGEQTAIVFDSPVTNTTNKISFNQLKEEVSKLAGGLQSLGLQKGDTAIIYMPMIPQALYAMLACARLGVIHSVVFGGFAPHELAIRIDDCHPKVIITASNGVEIDRIIPYKPFVDQAIKEAHHKPEKVVVFDRELGVDIEYQPYDIDYTSLVDKSVPAE
ncbi:MAG: propionyl-CoA synthetase, partial [Alteromonas sp.]|nr:propionyl-CoA synthetase [Alteromonas sp.]